MIVSNRASNQTFTRNQLKELPTAGQRIANICFYDLNKSKCPLSVDYMLGKNEYNSITSIYDYSRVHIHIVESIKLETTLLLSSNVYYIKGKDISGKIEIGVETIVNIQDATKADFILNWLVNSKRISKLYTFSKAKSIYIQILDQHNDNYSYELDFYSGKKTEFFIKNSKKNVFYSIKRKKSLFFIILNLINKKPELVTKETNTGFCGNEVVYSFFNNTLIISGKGKIFDYTYYDKPPWYSFRNLIAIVTIEYGVTSIGSCSFMHCMKIKSVLIPSSVTEIKNDSFRQCNSITKISIPNGVVSIEDYAFESCTSLISITIPSSVTFIGTEVFVYCFKLESILVSEFNKVYKSIDGVLFSKDQKILLVYPPNKNITHYDVPFTVTSIEKYAFFKCQKLISISIDSVQSIGKKSFESCFNLIMVNAPNNLKLIGDNAFESCKKLNSITISNNVESIGQKAFNNCQNLIFINVEKMNKNFESIDGVLFQKNNIKLLVYPAGKTNTSYEIPDKTYFIDNYAFSYCQNLRSIIMPNSIEKIGNNAFEYCSELLSITISNKVKLISDYSFYKCISLESITIPNSVTSIMTSSFYSCENLESVVILGNLTFILYNAFDNCISLNTIVYMGISQPVYSKKPFNGCKNLNSIIVSLSYENETFCDFKVTKDEKILCKFIDTQCSNCSFGNCLECNEGWILDSNKCYPNNTILIPHCIEYNMSTCVSCEFGYKLEHKKCVEELFLCHHIIQNCKYCQKINNNYKCSICIDGYVLGTNNLSCVHPMITQFQPLKPKQLFEEEINCYDKKYALMSNRYMHLITSEFYSEHDHTKTIFNVKLPEHIENIKIEPTFKLIQVTIPPPLNAIYENKTVIFEAYKTNYTVNFLNGGSINANGASLKGFGIVKLHSDENIYIFIKKITLDSLLPNAKNNPLTLITKIVRVEIVEIQVFYEQKIIGTTKSTYCDFLKLEEGSIFTPKNMSFKNAKIGFRSSMIIEDNTVAVSHFQIFYNLSQVIHNVVPIIFYYPFPSFTNTDIEIVQISQSKTLDEIYEKYIIAKFIGNDPNKSLAACKKLKFIDSNSFTNSQCVKDGRNYNLVVEKQLLSYKNINGKIGLLPGAIAGIVIGSFVFAFILTLIVFVGVMKIKERLKINDYNQQIDESLIET